MENLNEKESNGEITQATNKVGKMKILYKWGEWRDFLESGKQCHFCKKYVHMYAKAFKLDKR